MSRTETGQELLTPREAAARLKLPPETSTKQTAFALSRIGVHRVWVTSRDWRVSRTSLDLAIRRMLEQGQDVPPRLD